MRDKVKKGKNAWFDIFSLNKSILIKDWASKNKMLISFRMKWINEALTYRLSAIARVLLKREN